MTQPLDMESLVDILKREHDDAEDYYLSEIWPDQETANKYYEAEPFGDETEGRSQIVMPDVREAIDYMSISVLRTFLSGERVIEFEAVREEDEAGAEEATAAVHYNFMREQDGARLLRDWLQAGLLEPISVVKTICETEERVTREHVQLDQEMALGLQEGLLPLPEGAELEDIADNGDGSFVATLKITKIVKRFRDVSLPLEEFRFSRNLRDPDDKGYMAHVCLKTRSELVEMGFDRDQVDDLPTANELDGDTWRKDTVSWRDTGDMPHEMQTVLLCEEYARVDVDDDGIAEHVKVFRVESEVLLDAETGEPAIETVAEHPFGVFCSAPRAHRMVGDAFADKLMDLQRIRSVVVRQMQDAMYIANMPRPLVDMNSDMAGTTLEDILRPIPGSPIRYKNTPPIPFQAGLDVAKSLSVLEYWTGERETRTGITRLNQGLDADTLNKTATGAAMMQAQGQQSEESMARMFGEAFGRLMAKKLRLMKAEGAEFPVKIDGGYRMVSAANWPDEFNMIVRVGLGTGRKEQRLQYLFALGQLLERAMPTGEVRPGAAAKLIGETVTAMQLGQGDDYVYSPDEIEQQGGQEQPDPAMMEAQAKMQAEQQKLQAKTQADQARLQGDQMLAQARLQMGAEEAAQKQSLARQKAQFEAGLATQKAQFEADLALRKMAMEQEVARTKADNMPDNRPGGDLSK